MAYVNKVVLNKVDLIDLTQDNISDDKVLKGFTFHKADGSAGEGTYEAPVVFNPKTDIDVVEM